MTIVRHIIDPQTGQAIFVTPDNPATVGLDATIGSLANISGGGSWYSKTGPLVTDWAQLAASSGFLPLSGGSLNAGANLTVPGTLTAGGGAFTNRPTVGGTTVALTTDVVTWASISGKPTTIGGYGITDFNSLGDARWLGLNSLAEGLRSHDTRSVNHAPSYYLMNAVLQFKDGSVIGVPNHSANQFAQVLGWRGWSDDSGGGAGELAAGVDGRLYYRYGTNGAGWNAWLELARKAEVLALSGGTVSGVLTVTHGIVANATTSEAWTVNGWLRGISIPNAHVIQFGYGGSYSRWGIGASGDILYFANGGASDGGAYSAAYWMSFQPSVGIVMNAGLQVNANITASNFILSSDARLKRDLLPLYGALDRVEALRGYTFTHDRQPARRQAGIIAQDVQQVLPEAVHVDADGYLSVSYDALIPLLIEAVKELRRELRAVQRAA